MVWAAVATALTMAAAVIVERTAFRLAAGAEPAPHAAVPPARAARDRRRRNGARRAAGQSRETSARSRVAADRAAHRGSRPGANRQDARDRTGAVGVRARRPLPAQLVVVAARARAARARARPSQGPHGSAHRRARRFTSGRAGRRARRPDGHARPDGAAGHRRAGARHFLASRPAWRGAQGVRIRLRAVSAGVVGSRSGKPPQLHPRPGHLWHGPVAARLVPLDARPPHRGTRDGL